MSGVRVLLTACGFIKFTNSVEHAYNCFRLYLVAGYSVTYIVLLFAINKSLCDT